MVDRIKMKTGFGSKLGGMFAQARIEKWSFGEFIFYYLYRAHRYLSSVFHRLYRKTTVKAIARRWLIKGKERYFNFNGAKLPDITQDQSMLDAFSFVFWDTFRIPCYYQDNHAKSIVEKIDTYETEGPYGYTDDEFDVTVKAGDTVIDAGAWIGDFSAYAASKDATVYAFEPVAAIMRILEETARLNQGKIIPIQKGLGAQENEIPIFIDEENSGAASVRQSTRLKQETIKITSLDNFVKEHNIKVDFIKSDIEGAERDLLKGACETLKNQSPKLAICTYHLPDDPEVLEKLILDANPEYTVKHLRSKLFAMVLSGNNL
jgi:FkbM family methyltransferase